MSQGTPTGSFFTASQAIITGGSFTMIQSVAHASINGPKGGYERLLDAVAPNAVHDSGHAVDPPKCHPGTRVAIIQTIIDWIAGSNEANRDKLFTWLTGAAGSGKSAIGRSVCERCTEEGTLLASFFFGSKDPTRNHYKSFAATIAYQICKLHPGLRTAVTAAVDHNPLVFTQSLRTQLISLVMGPLSAIYANKPLHTPHLLVVDGLDECLDEASQQDILETLFYLATTSVIPIRILVCSRQESQIVAMFNPVNISSSMFKIVLDHESYKSKDDIKLYLYDQFQQIRKTHFFKTSIPSSWPTEGQLDEVTNKSSGQFIYATIVVRYLKSSRHRPHQRLDAILGLRPPFKDLPFSELDAVYLHLLNSTDNPFLATDILVFLALHDEMCTADIDTILGLQSGEAEVILSSLAAIVDLHPMHGHLSAASLLHKSFGDFIFDPHRSKGFSKMRTETQAWHLLRIIEIFSEKHKLCRLQHHYYGMPAFPFHLKTDSNAYPHWSPSAQLAFRNAVINFPMKMYCNEISSHSHLICADHKFLFNFFSLLAGLEEKQIITSELLHRHAQDFCNYALSELKGKYMDDWEMNFLFTDSYLEKPLQPWPWIPNSSFGWVIKRLHHDPVILETFQVLLSKSDKGLIISKAAMYCLQHLCDPLPTRKMAKSFLGTRRIDQNCRKTCPWKWHQRASFRYLSGRPVLTSYPGSPKQRLTTFTKLYNDNLYGLLHYDIYSLRSLQWNNWVSKRCITKTQSWREYLEYLEYLIAILPCAGKFPPLIHLCKTKAFAPASMMFPDRSRRARRAIQEYLNRVDTNTVQDY